MHENIPVFKDIAKKLNDYCRPYQSEHAAQTLEIDSAVELQFSSGKVSYLIRRGISGLFGGESLLLPCPKLVLHNTFARWQTADEKTYFLHSGRDKTFTRFGFYNRYTGLQLSEPAHRNFLNRVVPALYDATGILVKARTLQDERNVAISERVFQDRTFSIEDEDCIVSLASLVDYHDDLRSTQVAIYKAIARLAKSADNIFCEEESRLKKNIFLKKVSARKEFDFVGSRVNSWCEKSTKLTKLSNDLRRLTEEFFLSYRSYKNFTISEKEFSKRYKRYLTEFKRFCNDVDALDTYRGFTRYITHALLTLVFGIGFITGLTDMISYRCTGHYIWPYKTTSRRQVEDLCDTVISGIEAKIKI